MKLKIADGLSLPADEAVSQKYAFLGRSGSGKTYGAMKLAELFLSADAQVIALDWVGNWWALRLGQDGKSPGFEGVYIFGGEHADVPLEMTGGAMMADLLVDKHISAVLDLSPFRKAERTRFATAFAEQLFHRKKTARTACHLFLEEAQAFLPQMVRGDDARMVGVFEDIGKVGRNYGIGVSILSQRPQAVNKDVLNQTEVLLAFQTNGPQERKTISGWVVEHGDADVALINELPTLPRGDAFVWSPQWLQIRKQVHIAARVTYDASSTPTQQAKRVKPAALTPDDIESLGEAMKATVERAKADDPRELRARIAKLERELKAKPATPAPAAVARVEVPVLKDGQIQEIERLSAMLSERAVAVFAPLQTIVDQVKTAAAQMAEAIGRTRTIRTPYQPTRQPPPVQAREPVRKLLPRRVAESNGNLTGPEQRILDAIAWLTSIGVTEPEQPAVAFLAGYTYGGGAFNNPRGALRTKGLVDYVAGERIRLTDEGDAAANRPAAALTAEALQERVLERLPGPEQRLLRPLLDAYPNALTNEDLASQAHYTPNAGAFNNPRGRLRSLGLIDYPRPGHVVAKPLLFLE